MITGASTARSTRMLRYSSRLMSSPSSISRRRTMRPPGPVCGVTSFMPRIFEASCAASSAERASFHAAAFAAPAGVNLRLHHHHGHAELLRHFARVFGGGHHLAARRGHAETAENLLSLILVNFHASSVLGLIDSCC